MIGDAPSFVYVTSKIAIDGKSEYTVTMTSLRKLPDFPVRESRSPVPKASNTGSRRIVLTAKSLQMRAPVNVSEGENAVRVFGFGPNNAITRLCRL